MRRFYILAAFVLSMVGIARGADAPTQPGQPESGPGGKDYPFAECVMHRYGEGEKEYWIFEPGSPAPKTAPLIIFNHGWSAMNPNTYGAWIKHLIRRGNIVIYPKYQASLRTPMREFTPNAEATEKAAILELQSGDHVKPELDHVAMVGHSMGGAIVPNLAATAAADGLPVPKAICCVEPGDHMIGAARIQMPVADFSKIPAETLALVIVGDEDRLAKEDTAKMIFEGLKQIPPEGKNYVKLVSDDHGSPPLKATHMAPVAMEVLDVEEVPAVTASRLGGMGGIEGNSVDALDYFGTWKLFDGLTDAAFFGKNRKYALGNTPEQRYMGKWSDGTAVKELIVGE